MMGTPVWDFERGWVDPDTGFPTRAPETEAPAGYSAPAPGSYSWTEMLQPKIGSNAGKTIAGNSYNVFGMPGGGQASNAALTELLQSNALSRSNAPQQLLSQITGSTNGGSAGDFDYILGLDPRQQNWGIPSASFVKKDNTGFWEGAAKAYARGLAPMAAAAGAYGLAGLAAGAFGGAAAGGTATGASTMGTAGGVGGGVGSAAGGTAALAPAQLAGTTAAGGFSTAMPWAAQLAEGASLAGSGLTAAEAQALGLNSLAAWGGQGVNALGQFGINPTSITGSGTKGAGNMGWLDTLLNVGGNLASGYMQSRAAGNAADTQAQSASDANAMLGAMYAQNRADAEPWRQSGVNALGNLANAWTAYQQSPGYDFRLAEGEKAINRGAAARGGYDSGGTMKALNRYGQDYATQDFGNWWNQQAGLAGVGQTAVGQMGQYGQNTAAQQAQNVTGAGNARASGYVGQGNAWNNAIGNTLGYYNQSNALAQMLPYLNRGA